MRLPCYSLLLPRMFVRFALAAFLLLASHQGATCSTLSQITVVSGSACAEINNSSGGVDCKPLAGAENLILTTNPTALPGTATFISGDSSFTYTQMDGNIGYLLLDWIGQLSPTVYGNMIPFQYSFNVTENLTQPLAWSVSFAPAGAIYSYEQPAIISGGSSTIVSGHGTASGSPQDDSDSIDLEIGVQFFNQFPLTVPTGDEFTVSDVSVSIDIPAEAFIPEPASWHLMWAIIPILLFVSRRRGTGQV